VKNFPLSGIFFERRILGRSIIRAMNSLVKNHPSEELSSEESSGEEFS
jgi:hypothetical protein